MEGAETGFPYKGAKEHYILDIDNSELSKTVVKALQESVDSEKSQRHFLL